MAKGREDHEQRYEQKRRRDEAHARQMPTEDQPTLPPPPDPIRKEKTEPNRNDPCPCGSGKKYKKCCGRPKAG